MMAFNIQNKHPVYKLLALVALILLTVMTPLYADVSVNNMENNDKVASEVLPVPSGSLNRPSDVAAKTWVLQAEQWEFARNGESILSLPVLSDVINLWLKDRQKLIEIQYPGGEEGEFWVQELADWLVALGVPSNRMIIVPGSGSGDMIKFDLIKQ
jgi:hypothetical protein